MPKNTQTPSIGRIVHYQAHGSPNGQHRSEPRAAVITGVIKDPGGNIDNDVADVFVMNPHGLFFNQACQFDADGAPGTWRWPPRVG